MKKTLVAIIGLLAAIPVLTGCSAKSGISQMIEPDTIYEKALVFTRQAQIVRSLETKASISVTLLNELFPKRYPYDKGIYLFVGVITDLKDVKFDDLCKLSLNGKKPLEVTPVDRKSRLYQVVPIVTKWGRYWVVRFPAQKSTKYIIDCEIDPYGSARLSLQRPTPRR
ncbi:hypothetical protein [Hydrogenimonas sp.]